VGTNRSYLAKMQGCSPRSFPEHYWCHATRFCGKKILY